MPGSCRPVCIRRSFVSADPRMAEPAQNGADTVMPEFDGRERPIYTVPELPVSRCPVAASSGKFGFQHGQIVCNNQTVFLICPGRRDHGGLAITDRDASRYPKAANNDFSAVSCRGCRLRHPAPGFRSREESTDRCSLNASRGFDSTEVFPVILTQACISSLSSDAPSARFRLPEGSMVGGGCHGCGSGLPQEQRPRLAPTRATENDPR